MNAFLSSMWKFVLSYALIILIGFFLINWLSNGFLTIFLKVKASRGRLVLVNVRSKLLHYFVAGRVEGEYLVYHDRESKKSALKEPKRLVIPDEQVFYRAYGVNAVNVDEATGSIFKMDLKGVTGFDPIKFSNLYSRALTKPSLMEDKNLKTMIIVILVAVIIVGLGLYIVYSKLGSIGSAVEGIKQISGVNIG